MILIPKCLEKCRGRVSPLTGQPVRLLAAGGIYNGQTLAAALSLGAEAAWVGTRFLASDEATAAPYHKKAVLDATVTDTIRTTIYSGRPMRVFKTDYVREWEGPRAQESFQLRQQGQLPVATDRINTKKAGKPWSIVKTRGLLMGQCAGAIDEVKPARDIVRDMVNGAVDVLRHRATLIAKL